MNFEVFRNLLRYSLECGIYLLNQTKTNSLVVLEWFWEPTQLLSLCTAHPIALNGNCNMI